jgi:hypothetical protein
MVAFAMKFMKYNQEVCPDVFPERDWFEILLVE